MNAHITNTNTNRNVSAGTVARTAVLLLALTNQILSACGKPILPIDSAQLEQAITAGCTTVAALVNWWYNNSFTQAALAADEVYDQKKNSVH
jgi:SPP1 family holin